jgi:hypothetical protein
MYLRYFEKEAEAIIPQINPKIKNLTITLNMSGNHPFILPGDQ